MALPPEKLIVPLPPLVSVLVRVVPFRRYTSVPFAVATVTPVVGFDAAEFTTLAVAMAAGVMLDPSTLTAEMPVVVLVQLPLGT